MCIEGFNEARGTEAPGENINQSKQMKNVWESNSVEKVSNCSRGIVTSQSVLFSPSMNHC